MRLSRSHFALLFTAGALAVLGSLLFRSSDEDEVLARIREVAKAVETVPDENVVFRRARLNRVFGEALAPNVSFSAPELPTTTGAKELAELGSAAPRAFGEVVLSVGETDIHIERAAREARAVSVVTLAASRGGEVRREKRHVRFGLRQAGSSWQITTIDVAPRADEQPEARP